MNEWSIRNEIGTKLKIVFVVSIITVTVIVVPGVQQLIVLPCIVLLCPEPTQYRMKKHFLLPTLFNK